MSQPTLFETEPIKSEVVVQAAAERMSIWELEDLGNRFVARVVFSGGYDGVLDYLVPAELEDLLESGMRVMVPLGRGNRLTAGYCIDVKFFKDLPQLKDKTLKSIQSIIDNRRLLDDNMIRLTYWISDKYICPLGQVFEAMLPSGVRSNAGTRLTTVLYVAENADKLIKYLKQKNLVQENSSSRVSVQKLSAQKNSADTTAQNGSSNLETVLTTKQLHVLATLKNSSQPLTSTELQFAAKCSSAPIDALKRLGLLRAKTIRREKFDSDSLQTTSLVTEPHTLNADQANALAKIKIAVEQHRHKVFLLHGVTGSGKTEVYIQAIREAVSFNRQAIVLVPEISLTPQTVGRFRSRFQNVAVLHSHLTDSERHHQWSIIASGKVQVVVGTRSAVFAPLPNLGLIVIDEEHEGSFKQGTAPRYHARDVACKRAEFEKIPLVLGSATPSIESWYATTITNSSTQIVHDQNTQQGNNSIIVTNNQIQRSNDSIIVTNNQMQRSNDSIIVTNNQIQRGNDSIIVTNNQTQRVNDSIIVTNNQMREPANNTIASDDSGGDIQLSCELISMPARVKGLVLPRVEIVDLREEVRAKLTYGAIHRQLHGAIEETIKKNGQVILLLNRRGFSTHLQCPACGEVVKCDNCDVSLTHHRTEEIALCHYCDYQIPAPNICKECGFVGIRYQGFGTQKLEAEIRSRFAGVSVLRMDTDTMRGHGMHEDALSQFRDGKVQILLGTQMIAKGLDFPNVTLVGVINADTALHLPDFRAAERTFHLITQVAGRTGRSEKGGRVIVQTFTPDHPAIQAAANHDYEKFIKQELPVRKLLSYPPFSKMVRIVIRGESEKQTSEFAKDLAKKIEFIEDVMINSQTFQPELLPAKTADNKQTQISQTTAPTKRICKILGPAPASFAKLRNFYRFHLHIHSIFPNKLLKIIRQTNNSIKTPENIQWIIDVDPLDML